MTEERPLPKLAPRPRRKANLTATNRDAQAPAEPDAGITNPFASEPPQVPQAEPPAAATASRTAQRRPAPASSEKAQLGVKVTNELKGRARAAFKEAAYFEDVPTFEAFVARALEAEIRRIEAEYNNGRPLEPRQENLPRGRSMR